MLRFFRTIRKKLFAQQDARKYLVYAIGEIMPVVVGILIATFCVLVTPKTTSAQYDGKAFRHFTPHDGFPALAYRMEQGDDGEIYITGPSGLVTFDGYEIHVFTHDPYDSTSIMEGDIWEILNDKNGHLWITSPNGISIYDFETESFTKVFFADSIPPYTFGFGLTQSSNNLIWVGGENGVYSFTIPTSEKPVTEVAYVGIKELEGASNVIYDVIQGPNGMMWISSSKGLFFLDPQSGNITKAGPYKQIPDGVDIALNNMAVDDQSRTAWVSLNGGLLWFAEGEIEPVFLSTIGEENFELTDVLINTMHAAGDGSIWIATYNHGVLQFNPLTNKLNQYKVDATKASISENSVIHIMEDMDGNMWFSYPGSGVSMMYDKTWNYAFFDGIKVDDSVIDDLVNLEIDKNGNLWYMNRKELIFSPADGGAGKRFKPDNGSIASNSDERYLSKLLAAGDDFLFLPELGDPNGDLLHRFDIQEQRFTDAISIDSLVSSGSFTSDGTNLYWTVREKSKLVILDHEDMTTTSLDLPLRFPAAGDNADTTFYVNPVISKSGDLYLQYNSRFNNDLGYSERTYFKFDSVQQSFTQISLNAPKMDHAYKMSYRSIASTIQDGVFWTLTSIGLLKEDVIEGTSTMVLSEAIAKHYQYSDIFEDQEGNIWFNQFGVHISKVNPVTQQGQTLITELNRKPTFIDVIKQLPDGDIIAAGWGGYIRFNPAAIREQLTIDKLIIREFVTGATKHTGHLEDVEHEVEYEDNNISFRFVGINYRNADNKYRYRLLGYEDDWVDLGTQRNIFLANLPHGSYRFQVQATTSNSSFTDSSTTAELMFTIHPPWWRTTLAYFSYAVLVGGFVFSADRFQRKRLIQKERERATVKELEQAREIEKAYENLKSAQSQLIQQEKLASLGQLTAGIAHEIKNPLNFVNNFSSVSLELVDEAMDEVVMLEKRVPVETQGKETHDPVETHGRASLLQGLSDLLSDIKFNLAKIHEHGSRADGIVKSMLQHSRGGTGKMEPTDLNALVKEFTNLSYHGMRAGKDPIVAEVTLDLDGTIREVPLVYEDFSRAILNICTNAFDAMRGAVINDQGSMIGDREIGSVYTPHLKVRTKRDGGRVLIEIEDNGPGIPDDIKDKILQPFFTTKKGTQGTGLGLSITHDIVKAHGGDIQIVSELGKGTTFIITLAIQTT